MKRLPYALIVPGGYVSVSLDSRIGDFDEAEAESFLHTIRVINNSRSAEHKADTENPLIVRTSFSHPRVWDEIVTTLKNPSDPFIFNMEVLDDSEHDGATLQQLIKSLPKDYSHGFMVVVDQFAISQPNHPLLVVDLVDGAGRQFRALPSQIPSIENNLSAANMDFEEFAEAVDSSGVFRGFPSGER